MSTKPTAVPTASLWVSVPGSAYAGDWFSVNAGGSTCAWPSNTFYDFTNSRDGASPADRLVGGRGNANTSDYWSNTGWVTYSVRIQCRTADAVSPWSGWKSDGINIVNSPAPPAPGYPGGPIAYNVGGAGCEWPGYNPPPNVEHRVNAYNGACYWQNRFQQQDAGGNYIDAWGPWEPSDPGEWYNKPYTG